MSQRIVLFFSFLGLITLHACGPNYIVNEKRDIAAGAWAYADSLRFEAEIPDTSTVYDLWLSLDHSPDFEWQNLYVRVHTLFPDGRRLSSPLSLELADQGGVWQSDCNSKRCRFRVPIQEGAWFQQTGKYVFTIEQYMRVNPLPGVQSVAFQIIDTGKTKEEAMKK